MLKVNNVNVSSQSWFESLRQRSNPILCALSPANNQLPAVERHVLDTQARALGDPKAGAVQKFAHQPLNAGEVGEHLAHLGRTQNDGEPLRPLGANELTHFFDGDPQHLRVQEHQRRQSLVLGRRSYQAADSQVREELSDSRRR
jgi:hypothetical protein